MAKEYNFPMEEISRYIADLMHRFGNRWLKDTIARVGKDTLRKLSENDRLVGAARLVEKQGMLPLYICLGVTAALRFDIKTDASARELQQMLANKGIEVVLKNLCGLAPGDYLTEMVVRYYGMIGLILA